jgi:hypothetical protein
MADYKKMYATLFNAQTDAITLLQQAQRTTEEMYMEAPETDIRLMPPGQKHDDE